MLQVFSLNVAKVDLDITYTCMLQAYVSKCFIWILHMFAMFFRHFHKCFIRLFQVFHLSFFCMLQLLHLNVLKVDRLLCAWEAAGNASDVQGGMSDVRGGAGPLLVCSLPPCAGTLSGR
jgi:hypothetical protein